jgi:putative ABC transport system permease protein
MNENQAHNPPELGLRFLAWFCPPALYEGIEGDLCEQFEEDVKTSGARIARRKVCLECIPVFQTVYHFKK